MHILKKVVLLNLVAEKKPFTCPLFPQGIFGDEPAINNIFIMEKMVLLKMVLFRNNL
jgi:hypothetical protein